MAVASYWALFILYILAISGTKGSSGLGSVSNDEIDNKTLPIVSAGLHWSFNISKQIDPLLLILGWYILVVKVHFGGLNG